ncbi:hypothetical protein K502DRAFT_327918 [Neoconidiobolus thromboides FSU 785]|nr:hypothetical protein K502DRAFT_327918 [Neoconidiobolus thromboides FSU 785]
MNLVGIKHEDIFKWIDPSLIEHTLNQERRFTPKELDNNNLSVANNLSHPDFDCRDFKLISDKILIQELSRFIYFCLERFQTNLDDRDYIRNKSVVQRLFCITPSISDSKEEEILNRFKEKLDFPGYEDYVNTGMRNQIDIWSSCRKISLGNQSYLGFQIRTLRYSHKKFL